MVEEFFEKYEYRIFDSKIISTGVGNGALLEIGTGEGRSQNVLLCHARNLEIISAQTTIGVPEDDRDAIRILLQVGALEIYPTYGISIERNKHGHLEYILRRVNRIKHVDSETFYNLTIRLAEIADAIENNVFGSDYH